MPHPCGALVFCRKGGKSRKPPKALSHGAQREVTARGEQQTGGHASLLGKRKLPDRPLLCKSKQHSCLWRAQQSAHGSIRMCRCARLACRLWFPLSSRTRHPFEASGSEELSPKIESVPSASPETIRSEPPEWELLRPAAQLQDLAVGSTRFR